MEKVMLDRIAAGIGRCLLAGALLWGAPTSHAADAAGPPPVELFTRLPAMTHARLSPSGRHLSLIVPCANGNRCAAVMDLDPIGAARIVGSFSDADVAWLRWVNEDRLVYAAYRKKGGGDTFAVNLDGSEQQRLSGPGDDISTFDDGSDDVLVSEQRFDNIREPRGMKLSRLNTVTGQYRSISYGIPDHVEAWELDARDELRALMTEQKGKQAIWWRRGRDADWRKVTEFDVFSPSAFSLWHVDRDDTVFVTARRGADTEGIFKFDPKTGRVDPEPVLQVQGFDIDPHAETDPQTGHLVGVHLHTDRWQSYWFDERLAGVQHGVDAALPSGRMNRLFCGRCESSRFVVVRSSSDRQPGEYYLFDREKSSLQRIGAERPWIDEATQGRRSFHRVAARDGLPLPVYVTRPASAPSNKPLPAVVLVHGGPWVRGSSLEWDPEAQFLASRGYLVLQPEFRGSRGYGWQLFHEGWKQWGQAMQTDLADTVQWAVRQGWVDPQRVCVMGASYGGYAALMAPIATPGVFRCAVSLAGVTDIDLMYGVGWSDASEEWRRYGMPLLIGDRDKDAKMLAEASPLHRVAEIKIPLLVAQGSLDRRVPLEHESRFVDAARRAGVQVEELVYPDEGHGFGNADHYADYLRRVEAFLHKSLGKTD
jgi:dipeptidyl aminopeptidase/acylaminoacyl peptidase